jgi:hypothetical protein
MLTLDEVADLMRLISIVNRLGRNPAPALLMRQYSISSDTYDKRMIIFCGLQ